MQFMIDLLTEQPTALRVAATFLQSYADMRDGIAPPIAQRPPAGQPVPFVPPPPPPIVPAAATASTAAASSNLSSSVPVPPVPPVPLPPGGSLVPPPPPAHLLATAQPSASNAVSTVATASSPTVPSAPPEFDSANMPWDARIHQKKKSKKADGTWKLQKGIAAEIVERVTRELHASVINSQPQVPPAPSLPPGMPPLPPLGATPPPPVSDDAGNPYPPVPVPPAANVGVPDASNSGVVPGEVTFRSVVAKISAARNATPPRLSPEDVNAICAQAGVPNLQMLQSMGHKVPEVDAIVDAWLVTR